MSPTLRLMFSQDLIVIYIKDCSICLVAVLELAAASFCRPTKAFLSGVLPSLASLNHSLYFRYTR
jgi:hypothetical protein